VERLVVPEQSGRTGGHRSEECLPVDRSKDITGDIRHHH